MTSSVTSRPLGASHRHIPTLMARLRHTRRARSVRSWARTRLRKADAVIVDTETTDLFGHIVQVSVIDLHGAVLLNELVKPATGIHPAATAVHGITDADVAAAPGLAGIAPQLLEVTAKRKLLAYNAPYDHTVLTVDLANAGVDPAHLADQHRWTCLMRARAAAERRHWVKLDGPHDALGDCLAALELLHRLAGRPTPRTGTAPTPAN